MINTAYPLQVGFIAWSPDYRLTAAAPAPVNFTVHTIGGPRTAEQIQREIDACESCLATLRIELTQAKPKGDE